MFFSLEIFCIFCGALALGFVLFLIFGRIFFLHSTFNLHQLNTVLDKIEKNIIVADRILSDCAKYDTTFFIFKQSNFPDYQICIDTNLQLIRATKAYKTRLLNLKKAVLPAWRSCDEKSYVAFNINIRKDLKLLDKFGKAIFHQMHVVSKVLKTHHYEYAHLLMLPAPEQKELFT